MERRVSAAFQLSDELVDQNGQARFADVDWGTPAKEDASIAPWIEQDPPPTPPPKQYPIGPLQNPSSVSRGFGFPSKNSLVSLVSLRQNSTSSVYRSNGGSSIRSSETQITLTVPERKRRSADDSESSRGLFYSGSSTNSGEMHKSKSSYNLFSKLKSRPSKTHLRSESEDSEHPSHPSLRPPIPPIPQQRYPNPLFSSISSNSSTPTIVSIPSSVTSKGKRDKGKKRLGSKMPPPPPAKDASIASQDSLDLASKMGVVDFSPDQLEGIVDFSIAAGGLYSSSSASHGFAGMRDPNSPSSGFDSAQSHSDHSTYFHQHFLPQTEFSDPFSSTSPQDKRKGMISSPEPWKPLPKYPNPPPPHGFLHAQGLATSPTDGPGSPSWAAPDSWAVDKGTGDYYTIPELSEGYNSDSDDGNATMGPLSNGAGKSRTEDRPRRRARNVGSVSLSSMASSSALGTGTLSRLRSQPPPGATYRMRMYTPNSAYHVIAIDLDITVAGLTAKLSKKMPQTKNGRVYLYLKEQGRERILGPHERPAAIVKLRMEQAGYDYEDGQHLLGIENLNILLKFVYKAQLLAGEEQINLSSYEVVDLTGQGLRVIPLGLYKNADQIVFLKLDRNPMIEIPLDFIQSCTVLRDLRMSYMSMKKVPQNIRHSTSLHRLDISCNSIRDLEDAILDPIPQLYTIHAQNNRLENLPWHFARLKTLTTLNISNNKFRTFPQVLTQITTLRDLDVSFNMITELPDQIGALTALERLTLVGNQVSKFPDQIVDLVMLQVLDIRRNQFSDLALVCNLPSLHTLSADHNAVHALDLSLGPRLKTLVVSQNDITQLTISPGPLGRPPYALTTLDVSCAKLSSLDDLVVSHLSSLRVLKLDHNSFRSLPDSLGDLKWLENLSCTDNKLDYLPNSIGRLQELTTLDAHNNNLNELPQTLWECSKLSKINLTSNFLSSWPEPPIVAKEMYIVDGSLAAPGAPPRKGSVASISSVRSLPALVHSLEKLYIGENLLTDNSVVPLMIFKELKVLNMSFNEIQDLPPNFFRSMTLLEELYLSGNKLTSIPSEDFPRLTKLATIFLNGNRLVSLPQELGKVANLTVLDVGSNYLKYNINNWEFDWNWNFNTNLKYLNLSGNKRLQIKAESSPSSVRTGKHSHVSTTPMLSGFTSLHQLKVLGLMDVTITNTSQDATVDIPDENIDRRVRTSLSTVCGMGYGIADSMGKHDTLTMVDLVHEFHGRQDEALFAMFGRTHPPKHLPQGASPNRLTKYLHDNFVSVFKTQLAAVNNKQEKEGVPHHQRKEGIPKALVWTFLKLNQDLWEVLQTTRKNSQVSLNKPHTIESAYSRTGVSCVAVYFFDRTLYAANVGNALAIGSRQGVYHEISRKHDPFDRNETIRIRSAEGSISPSGLVNDDAEAKVSRSFGYYHLFPAINARPDILIYDLSDMDEFIIIANSGLWDFVPYQTAVDIARSVIRTDRPDPMLAAQKLRDFAISYGADGSVMIMVVWVADLFNTPSRSRQPTLDPILDQSYRRRRPEDQRPGFKFLDYEIPAPTGHVTLVFTDIRNSTHLWEANPGMPTAMRLHNTLLRRQLRLCGGYEVKTEGDSFMCSFPTTLAAVWWCLTVQVQLLNEPWPLEILECEDGKPIYDPEGRLIACGLSVRMGIHSGMPLCEPDLITHRMDYFGPMVNRSARIESNALGGQISCSNDIIREINARVSEIEEETEYSKLQNPNAIEGIRDIGLVIIPVGEVKLKGIELPEILSIIYPSGLEGRHDLKDAPVDPTASASRIQFSVPQIQELGMLCLRIEALSTRRLFKPLPERKNSTQSNVEFEGSVDNSHIFYSDPNLLLPPINYNSTDAELMRVLDSLSLRIANAINTVCEQYQVAPTEPAVPAITKDTLMAALLNDGFLDEETLRYIATKLD